MYSRNVKYIGGHLITSNYKYDTDFRWPLPSKKNGVVKSFREGYSLWPKLN